VVTPGELYVAVVVVLLLFALGVCLPVLKRVVVEGIERRRRWNSGELARYSDDETSLEESAAAPEAGPEERSPTTCDRCDTENEPGYSYCRRCAAPL